MALLRNALLAALVFTLVAPILARMDLGIEDPTFSKKNSSLRLEIMRKGRALGATYVREFLMWEDVHPCVGETAIQAKLAKMDAVIVNASSVGLKVQMVLSGVTGGWGTPKGPNCHVPALGNIDLNSDLTLFNEFISTYVVHFARLGVRRFSIWNEPNGGYICKPSPNNASACLKNVRPRTIGAIYGRLYRSADGIIQRLKASRQIPPSVRVLIGELASTVQLEFLDGMVSGGRLEADGFAYHPYQWCIPPYTQKKVFATKTCRWSHVGIAYIGTIQTKLRELASKGKLVLRGTERTHLPVYMTEFGYFQQCPLGTNQTHGFCSIGLREALRAQWYVDTLNIAKKHGVREFVLFQFTPTSPGEWNTAMLNTSATNYAPTGSYRAIWRWAKKYGYPVQSLAS